jgi:glycosyltransferase involved in cell wall biosynthesis
VSHSVLSLGQRLHICYITKSKIPSAEANSIQVMKMCAALAGHGAQTELIIPFRPREWWRTTRRQIDPWDWYAVPRTFRLTRILYPYPGRALNRRSEGFAYGLAAAWHVLARRPDLAYTRDPWVARWLAQWGQPLVFEAHHPAQEMAHPAFPRFLAQARKESSLRGIVAISQGAADAYVAAGVPASKVHVLHDGVDLERFDSAPAKGAARRQLGLPNERKIAAHVGHLYRGRGAELILQCAAQLPNVLFLFVGGLPADIARCQEVADDLGLGNVRFVGLVPNAQVPSYLAAADVLVMPYTSATPTVQSMSPLKMFEYMAASRPIVASDFATVREVLTHEVNALLVEPDDADALLAGLQRILSDRAMAERIAAQARSDVERHTWPKRAASILERFVATPLLARARGG